MNNTRLNKIKYLESTEYAAFFNIFIDVNIPFFRVSLTIEPRLSLLLVLYREIFDQAKS